MNKRCRNVGTNGNRELRWMDYRYQKEKVRRKISEEMRKYEEGVAEEVRSMGKGRQMWRMIRKLKGEKAKKDEKVNLYTKEGAELEVEQYEEQLRNFWQNIY